jgi:virginiamycin B lyase
VISYAAPLRCAAMRLNIAFAVLVSCGAFAADAEAVAIKGWPNQPRSAYIDGIARGPDGAMWMTDSLDDRNSTARVLRVGLNGTRKVFKLPRASWAAGYENNTGIIAGPDGALWLSLGHAGPTGEAVYEIGRMSTSGELSVFPLPSPRFRPSALAIGPDRAIWFTEQAESDDGRDIQRRIGRITQSGAVTEYRLGSTRDRGYGGPDSIARGPDGAMWFTDSAVGKVGRITMRGKVTKFGLKGFWRPSCVDPVGAHSTCSPVSITSGPGKALWFAGLFGDKIVRLSTQGRLTVFRVPPLGSQPTIIRSITRGPDRAIWFATGATVGRLSAGGASRQWPFPSTISVGGGPIRSGPHRTLWFKASKGFGRISQISNLGP